MRQIMADPFVPFIISVHLFHLLYSFSELQIRTTLTSRATNVGTLVLCIGGMTPSTSASFSAASTLLPYASIRKEMGMLCFWCYLQNQLSSNDWPWLASFCSIGHSWIWPVERHKSNLCFPGPVKFVPLVQLGQLPTNVAFHYPRTPRRGEEFPELKNWADGLEDSKIHFVKVLESGGQEIQPACIGKVSQLKIWNLTKRITR